MMEITITPIVLTGEDDIAPLCEHDEDHPAEFQLDLQGEDVMYVGADCLVTVLRAFFAPLPKVTG